MRFLSEIHGAQASGRLELNLFQTIANTAILAMKYFLNLAFVIRFLPMTTCIAPGLLFQWMMEIWSTSAMPVIKTFHR